MADNMTVAGRDGTVYVFEKRGDVWYFDSGFGFVAMHPTAGTALCDALLAARREMAKWERACRLVVDSAYGTAFHHIGDGDGMTFEQAEFVRGLFAPLKEAPDGR